MADLAQIRELTARKKLLVATADVQRLLLAEECTRVSRKLSGLEAGFQTARKAVPYIKLAAPLAALFMLRRKPGRSDGSLLQKASAGLRAASLGFKLWRSWKSRPGAASPDC